ncbi:MAG TPA: hypothetical protein VJ746_10150 [Nitrospira sp.]|nr:hypothetical protein [Nitrospira sp.]
MTKIMLSAVLRISFTVMVLVVAPSCVSHRHVSQPVLERNGQTLSSEDRTGAEDLLACRSETDRTAPLTIQPRWVPPLATAANGAVVTGTVDAPHRAWPSRDAYRNALERCLAGRGYEVRGWQ